MPTSRDLRATYRPSEEERCVVLAGELGHDEGMRYSGERGVRHGLLKEVRDDDARLFNDHHNRFDVMDSAMVYSAGHPASGRLGHVHGTSIEQ